MPKRPNNISAAPASSKPSASTLKAHLSFGKPRHSMKSYHSMSGTSPAKVLYWQTHQPSKINYTTDDSCS